MKVIILGYRGRYRRCGGNMKVLIFSCPYSRGGKGSEVAVTPEH